MPCKHRNDNGPQWRESVLLSWLSPQTKKYLGGIGETRLVLLSCATESLRRYPSLSSLLSLTTRKPSRGDTIIVSPGKPTTRLIYRDRSIAGDSEWTSTMWSLCRNRAGQWRHTNTRSPCWSAGDILSCSTRTTIRVVLRRTKLMKTISSQPKTPTQKSTMDEFLQEAKCEHPTTYSRGSSIKMSVAHTYSQTLCLSNSTVGQWERRV